MDICLSLSNTYVLLTFVSVIIKLFVLGISVTTVHLPHHPSPPPPSSHTFSDLYIRCQCYHHLSNNSHACKSCTHEQSTCNLRKHSRHMLFCPRLSHRTPLVLYLSVPNDGTNCHGDCAISALISTTRLPPLTNCDTSHEWGGSSLLSIALRSSHP